MAQYIDKAAVIAEIERLDNSIGSDRFLSEYEKGCNQGKEEVCDTLRNFLDTLDVVDPYEQWCQHDSIKSGIQAHADTYSFNIESELFNQLTKEQQKLWRKEIEQACISGGEVGVNLAKDPRYKENLEVKEVDYKPIDKDFERDAVQFCFDNGLNTTPRIAKTIARHFYELGLKAQKGE